MYSEKIHYLDFLVKGCASNTLEETYSVFIFYLKKYNINVPLFDFEISQTTIT